ncbi:MAG: prolipoprotein diacylglyceryl transferase [Clostridia bacterium]|nr:prolipoprotein diacylglyceryl transferase [Clostridia bacterium]
MFPYEIFSGFDTYALMLCIGLVAAILSFRFVSDKTNISGKLQNLCLYNGVVSIGFGYFSAVFFQAMYNIAKNGGFVIDSKTGATFYGGLVGGAAIFLIIYFVAGAVIFKEGGEHKKKFWIMSDVACASIALGHAFGRIGCLFAGCCHGAETDAWYGIYMQSIDKKVIPTQLFEAIFLFALSAFFFVRVKKHKTYNLPIYMGAYGAWRFALEYMRDDYRGTTVVDFLTPSQFIALLMIIGAVVLYIIEKALIEKAENEVDQEIVGVAKEE